ncbi:AAA family ATPase [Teichococcus cervicalis]|uniref:CobQ/CobB/MinD/ParA nucleotide binding domain protein n=1 Tax=Pseudoroseomonas cervicalis ATCC 49957 TaxID=525371 RepID=D5RM42_9PROT|nr:AAA family ATPase [Pseudoroseomonas cervicalis]EFH11625.1 CobQ/CobB/MinD/ParA nucleotide binding domain protein [Pseudoroseomonas cervicalis ATCC 49957]
MMSDLAPSAEPQPRFEPGPAAGPAPGKLVAIASGKGGVGKTWMAITLAQTLAQRGRRVLLADGDLGLANVDVQLGLQPERDLQAVLSGKIALTQAVMHHAEGGFDVLAGRSGSGALASLRPEVVEHVAALLRAATGRWDVVLLDLGAGLAPATRRLAAAADTLLVVATDEPTSLTDAYAVLKLHGTDRPGGDCRIVVNQAVDIPSGRRTAAALQRACATFLRRDVPLAGLVRRDERVRDTIRRQTPLLSRHPNSAAAADVAMLARAVDP